MNLNSLLMFAACFSLLTVNGSCMQNNNYRQRQHSLNRKSQQPVLQKQAIPSQRSKAVNKDRKFQTNNMLNGSKQQKQRRMFNQQGPRMGLQGNQFSNQMSGVKQPGQQFSNQMPGFVPPGQQFRQQGQGTIPPGQQFNQQGQGFPQYGMQQQRPMNSSYTYSNAQIKTTPTTPTKNKRQMNNIKPYRSNDIMPNQ